MMHGRKNIKINCLIGGMEWLIDVRFSHVKLCYFQRTQNFICLVSFLKQYVTSRSLYCVYLSLLRLKETYAKIIEICI